jgi:hypothetical protein
MRRKNDNLTERAEQADAKERTVEGDLSDKGAKGNEKGKDRRTTEGQEGQSGFSIHVTAGIVMSVVLTVAGGLLSHP